MSGLVLGAEGTRKTVAAIAPSGSVRSSSTADAFALTGFDWPSFTLRVTTDDGRVAVLEDVALGSRDLRIVPEAGGAIEVDAVERDGLRCAVLRDGVFVENFTLRRGRPARVALPPGSFVLRLSDEQGMTVHTESHTIGSPTAQECRTTPETPSSSGRP